METATNRSKPFTEAELRGLFSDSFGPWTVQVDSVAVAGKRKDDNAQRVSGTVLFDGETVGRFQRRINMDWHSVNHTSLELIAAAQGQGFATQWIARCRARYRAAGIDRIDVDAIDDGRTVWARMGFEADQTEWLRILDVAQYLDGADTERLIELQSQPPQVRMLADVRAKHGSVLELMDWTGSMAA